jgi:hypothetical protein
LDNNFTFSIWQLTALVDQLATDVPTGIMFFPLKQINSGSESVNNFGYSNDRV